MRGKTEGKINEGQNTKRGTEKKQDCELVDKLCRKQLFSVFCQTKSKVAK